MGKKAERGAKKRKKAVVKDLPASDAKTRNVKGGFIGGIGKAIGGAIKTVSPL